jgi:hypothetical protein
MDSMQGIVCRVSFSFWFVSELILDIQIMTSQKMMTHKRPQMTQRYAHLTDTALKRGANVMSCIVKEAGETA